MISREQAREIAERFLRDHHPTPGLDSIGDILSPDEVKAWIRDHPGRVTTDKRWYGCWVVLILGAAGAMIRISDSDGAIEFAGSVKGDPRLYRWRVLCHCHERTGAARWPVAA